MTMHEVWCMASTYETISSVGSSVYGMWWAISALGRCGPSMRIAWAAPVQKTRPEKLLMDPNGSVRTKMFHLPDVNNDVCFFAIA